MPWFVSLQQHKYRSADYIHFNITDLLRIWNSQRW